MDKPMAFSGFPAEGLQFLKDLAANNNREWFKAHEEIYRRSLLDPVQPFVTELGARLKTISAGITYNLQANGSIMRIYRDIRFSADKTPYNASLRVLFWEGKLKKTENPGFYFWMDGDGGGLFVGMHRFPKDVLDAYRRAVVDPILGKELVEAIAAVEGAGCEVGGETYKRIPPGYPVDPERAGLLLYGGLYAMSPKITISTLTSADLVRVCYEHSRNMAPVHRWLVDLMTGG